MSGGTRLIWPTKTDEALRAAVHRVIHAVVEQGGAVGYLQPPDRGVTDSLLDAVVADAGRGDAGLVLAKVAGRVEGMGLWRRGPGPVYRHSAEVGKVMAHPSARGLGLGLLIVRALIPHAREAGIELLTLGVRGNNHGAIELYERAGFLVWGVLPNSIAVGRDRFDDVRMRLEIARPPGVVHRGSSPGGPGSSSPRAPRAIS
ncbi:GNAT family N-acetyltransferase [Sphaerisporangium sp. TRM90804]|uniref:GNAT family N-acetyltransferase n=1 Tax=Sphaerisporangium sp. TRM90804 TaxID=3031113 RepID=UPI00244708A1|nr:GNAT family N-acetyltransferase [Sphaerisporangium sp. TRM90804]MDH2429176.1 GNAT family N-acetyltransferase [Sphaerisporangium sp. TRM90804]